MLSRNQVRHLHSLKLSKFRKVHQQFIAEGVKLADEFLESSFEVSEIFALHTWLEYKEELLLKKKIRYFEISQAELHRISHLVTPNEVMMIVNIPDQDTGLLSLPDLTLFLDRIQDPGNMGTIIRTADWFGINTIICSPGCADIFNPKVVQATMGSITRVRVLEKDPVEFLSYARSKAAVYGTLAEGANIYEMEVSTPAVIIIGNESQGISADLQPFIHHQIGIPRFSDKAESLNAAVATAVICSEFKRRM